MSSTGLVRPYGEQDVERLRAPAITGGDSETTALAGSTEESQFKT